jgi:cytochrome c oxidase assembly protein subunit 11
MQFYVDPQLPEEISYFTVQYTLFDVTARASDMKTKPNPYMVPQPESGK